MARDVSTRGPMLLPAFKLAASNFPRRSVKPLNQSIADIELNDASVGTKAPIVGVAVTKTNVNVVVLGNPPLTNDDELEHLASDIACQERREECPLSKTGTTMCC